MPSRFSHTDDLESESGPHTTSTRASVTHAYIDTLNALVKEAEKTFDENSLPRSNSYSNGTSRPRHNSIETFNPIGHFLSEIAEAVTQRPTPPMRPNSPIRILKRYEGFVTSVEDETFIATIWEQGKEWPRLEAEFLTDVVEHNDQELVQTNAPIFVMSLEIKYAGDHWARTSQVRFRRVLPVDGNDVDVAYSTINTESSLSNGAASEQNTSHS